MQFCIRKQRLRLSVSESKTKFRRLFKNVQLIFIMLILIPESRSALQIIQRTDTLTVITLP